MAIQLSRVDHHKVLGVSPSASPAQIDDAYQTLTAQLRDQPWQFERTRAIDRAYRALSRGGPVPAADAPLPNPDHEPFMANSGSEPVARDYARDEPMLGGTHAAASETTDHFVEDRVAEDRLTEGAYLEDQHTGSNYAGDPYAADYRHDDVRTHDRPFEKEAGDRTYVADTPDEPYDDHDDRPSRKPFYVVGAIGVAAVLGTLLYPASRNSTGAPGDGSTTGSVVSSIPQADSTTGSPAATVTEPGTSLAEIVSALGGAPTETTTSPTAGEQSSGTGDRPFESGADAIVPPEQSGDEPGSSATTDDQGSSEPAPTDRALADRGSDDASEPTPIQAPPPRLAEARPRPQAPAASRAARAQWVRGGLVDSDNRGGQFEGAVGVRISVSRSGRPSDCSVAQSSGNATLDSTTCRLLVERLEFTPARDAAGNPIPTEVNSTHVWTRRGRRR